MSKLYVCCKETGDKIERVASVEVGLELIKEYEEEDKKEGNYVEDFYDIVDEDYNSILN